MLSRMFPGGPESSLSERQIWQGHWNVRGKVLARKGEVFLPDCRLCLQKGGFEAQLLHLPTQ